MKFQNKTAQNKHTISERVARIQEYFFSQFHLLQNKNPAEGNDMIPSAGLFSFQGGLTHFEVVAAILYVNPREMPVTIRPSTMIKISLAYHI